MGVRIGILVVYALGVVLIGWLAGFRKSESAAEYFLAGRRLGPLIFLATMAATNFSAFTVFGASGAGYRDGFSFFPIVGFGTGFMALTFYFIGVKAYRAGLETGALTPPDLVRRLYGSKGVSGLFALVMVVFTLPYIALQPIAAGYALKELLGLNYVVGAALVTGLVVFYTFQGGMRSVAWTDAFQGGLMLVLLAVAVVVVASREGGLLAVNAKLLSRYPDLFSRPGPGGKYTPTIWFSFMFLWFFCDPMFPQLFQRFLAAKDVKAIRFATLSYPLLCSVVFLLPVTLGILGRLSHPGLQEKAADHILPLLAADLPGNVLGSLVVACGLAALMSTLDSQLLTLSSIFTEDLYPLVFGKRPRGAWPGKVFVLVLALAGFLLAVRPPSTILSIAKQTFTGLAVLFPAVLFGLYASVRSAKAAWVSIVLGEGMVALYYFKLLPAFGFLPVVPVMVVTFAGYLAVTALEGRLRMELPTFLRSPFFYGFLAIFVLAMDFWRWHAAPGLVLGYPDWVIYFIGLSAAQTGLAYAWTRRRLSRNVQRYTFPASQIQTRRGSLFWGISPRKRRRRTLQLRRLRRE